MYTATDIWGADIYLDIEPFDDDEYSWTMKQEYNLVAYLNQIASSLIFSNKTVIARVDALVRETMKKAKAEELEPEEVLDIINPENVFSKEERDEIELNFKLYGRVIENHRLNDEKVDMPN